MTSNDDTEPTKEQLEEEFSADDKDLVHAATKIQAQFRGFTARKQQKQDEEDTKVAELGKQVEELDIDLTDPELNVAATKIQATFRGHKTRQETQPDKPQA